MPPGTATKRKSSRAKKPPVPVSDDSDSDFEPADFVPAKRPSTSAKPPSRKTSTASTTKKSPPSKKSKKEPLQDISNKAEKEVQSKFVLDLGLDPKRPSAKTKKRQDFANNNLVRALDNFMRGITSKMTIENRARNAVVEELEQFDIYKSVNPSDRRGTAIAWHPTHPTYCAVGFKGGDVILWNYEKDKYDVNVIGPGPGGSIQNIKFDKENPSKVYTCSIDGTFMARDFSQKKEKNFLDTNNWDKWYTSFDVSYLDRTLLVGDNNGYVTLLTNQGEEVWKLKLHKSKVTNIEYSPKEPWLVVTTSTDSSVKIWDIRNISDKSSSLSVLNHEKAVNSAYFNQVDGTRLVTTDQKDQLRVYSGPNWNLERTIGHPHRQFQHLTPIRAVWHPLVDLIVAGRYPDPKFPDYVEGEARSIDFFDADSGKIKYQLSNPKFNKIVSLNAFNKMGDALLSSSAGTILIWKKKPETEVDFDDGDDDKKDPKYADWWTKWPTQRMGGDQKKRKDGGGKKKKKAESTSSAAATTTTSRKLKEKMKKSKE